jgi:hypothetical protein
MTPATNGSPVWSTVCQPHLPSCRCYSLNGAYKIELVMAKRKYLEQRNQPKSEPNHIVSLVSMAFEKKLWNSKKKDTAKFKHC